MMKKFNGVIWLDFYWQKWMKFFFLFFLTPPSLKNTLILILFCFLFLDLEIFFSYISFLYKINDNFVHLFIHSDDKLKRNKWNKMNDRNWSKTFKMNINRDTLLLLLLLFGYCRFQIFHYFYFSTIKDGYIWMYVACFFSFFDQKKEKKEPDENKTKTM